MRLVAASLIAACIACTASLGTAAARGPARPLLAVGYSSDAALRHAVAGRADVVRLLPALHVAEVRPRSAGFAAAAYRIPGISYVQRAVPRSSTLEPALVTPPGFAAPFEWQFAAVHEDAVPASVLRAASSVTIAVIDTGADVTAPDLATKSPRTYNLSTGTADVSDTNGHGTFVSSLAAGSVTNGDGIAGFGGDAKLLVIKASHADGSMSDVDEASAIIYAVDHGARVVNLSVGGSVTSFTEHRGIQYAADHGALVVAAVGNEFEEGNPIEYPAALLQPVGSNGNGGSGLAVGASTLTGARAFFSNTGSQLSLVAPGQDVFAAVSSLSAVDEYPRAALPGSSAGAYGFASGTSFSTPEVAGAAALVMAANPLLRASDAAAILKQTASGHGSWNPRTGYGILDVAAAVAMAQGRTIVSVMAKRSRGRVHLSWRSVATHFRISVSVDGSATRVLLRDTTHTAATFAVRAGHRYVFTVDALGSDGTVTASSSASIRT